MDARARLLLAVCSLVLFCGIAAQHGLAAEERPNVVLVMTDDQGYGDLGCHGNSQIKTPQIDALHGQSVRLTNFHVDPTCSPTRSALLTGRYSSRTGVWHTIMGRSLLHPEEITLGEVFANNGYRTGAFGKWHLGDNYPCRPQDQGFHETLVHGGGGVGQTPDFWGNDYFDDTYWHNGETKQFSGYCTDVFFDGALRFIEENRESPFFVYLPTNAAHGPFLVAEKYSCPYKDMGIPSPRAEFYGMITNIDENVGRLRSKLDEWGLADNTLLIFMTDNGTAAGVDRQGGFNAGMRGRKGSQYEGGHRVPCFFHWPGGGLDEGRDVAELTAHVDLLPTLVELCRLDPVETLPLDGKSLAPLLTGRGALAPRTLFVHSQRIEHPRKWKSSAVMTQRWRLIDGEELFDVQADPGQRQDLADAHPEVVRRLREQYEQWWGSISTRFDDYVRIGLGSPHENPSRLTCHDWHTNNGPVPWNQGHIRRGLAANGFWAVDVLQPGRYEFALRKRGDGVEFSLKAGTARLEIGAVSETWPITPGSSAAKVAVDLEAGPARLQTWLDEEGEPERGAYFVEIRRLD